MTPPKEDSSRGRRSTTDPTDRSARVRRVPRNNPSQGSHRPRPRPPRASSRSDITGSRQRFGVNVHENIRTGRVNRRIGSQSFRRVPLIATRESLEILHGYLEECERNLAEGQLQRGQLAQMVSQLSEARRFSPMDAVEFLEDMMPYQGSNRTPYGTRPEDPAVDPMESNSNDFQARNDLPDLINALRVMADAIIESPEENAEAQPRRRDTATSIVGEASMNVSASVPPSSMVEGIDMLAAGDGYHVLPINTVQLSRSTDNIFAFVLELNDNPIEASMPRPPTDSDQD